MTPLTLLYDAFKQGRIKKISNKVYELDENVVIIKNKQGRKLITCSCLNHTKFCSSPAFCFHKFLAINYPLFEYYDSKINELLNFININEKLSEKNRVGIKEIKLMVEEIKRIR